MDFPWIFHDTSSHWGTPMAVQVPGSPSFSKEHEDFDLAWLEGVDENLPGPRGPKWSKLLLSGATNMEVSQIPKLRHLGKVGKPPFGLGNILDIFRFPKRI